MGKILLNVVGFAIMCHILLSELSINPKSFFKISSLKIYKNLHQDW